MAEAGIAIENHSEGLRSLIIVPMLGVVDEWVHSCKIEHRMHKSAHVKSIRQHHHTYHDVEIVCLRSMCVGVCMVFSLVPRLFPGGGKRAWYTLYAIRPYINDVMLKQLM